MAEQEVIKHTKKVLGTLRNKNTGWKHKVKEILLEIAIIVFAVSLSIYLHNWSEKRHDRHEERTFLEGLKTDLQNDITEMQGDLNSYYRMKAGYEYFQKVAVGESLNTDSMLKYQPVFFNTTFISPNISRFEGLKASGKLSIIENKELLNNILDLYQENIPYLNMLNSYFNDYKTRQLRPLLDQRLDFSKSAIGNWEEVLRTNEIKNSLRHSDDINEVIKNYSKTIENIRSIIKEIDEELK
ncbi:MAG: hypothetical protein QM731_20015 [Chitinophagaceae bacterium]